MKYRILRMFGIILAAAVILASTATTASAAAACNVVYTISPQNTTAFGATLVIDNTGTTNWTSWTLTWSFANGQTVSSLWNGIETQSGANVTVASESYNGAVAAGGNVSGVGFNGTWNGSANAVPTNFAVNGTACNGVVSTGSFKLASSPASLSIAQGASGTDTITVTDTAPFAGSVTLAASGLPAGVTAAFGTNPAAASSVLTLTASSTATAGTSTVTITGTSGSLSATASIALTVTAASVGSFKLTPSASTLSIAQGASGADTITVTDTAPFAGSVTLAASGLPAGVTAAFATNPATSTSVLTLTASSTAAAATSTITITGTSGSLSASTTVALTVTAVSCTPTAIVPYIQVGTAAWQQTNAVTVTSTTTVVNLGPQPIAGTWSWTGPNGYTSAARQINAVPLGAGANVYVATYTNASNCKSTATFTITAPSSTGSFKLTPSAASLSIAQGASGTDTITVTDTAPFAGSVTLAASGLPAGVTAAFATNPATTTSVLTLTVASTAAAATTTITITGTSGTLSASTTIALTVTAVSTGSFKLAASAPSLSIAQGASGTDTITVTDTAPFAGSVTLAASGLPTGVTAAFATNPSTSTSVLTLSASSTAAAGTSTVTVTGTSGSLTSTTTISITVTASSKTGTFTLAPSASALTVHLGSGATDTITVTDVVGFTGSVQLTASSMPSGVTSSWTSNPTTTSAVLSFVASSSAAAGTYTITITGSSTGTSSGTLNASTTIALTVSSAQELGIAWVSPAAGTAGSSADIMPGNGLSWSGSQGSSVVYVGTTAATVTTWAINSVEFTVPATLAAGTYNVTAVVGGVTSNAVPFTVTAATPSPQTFTGNGTWFTNLGAPYGGCGVPQQYIDTQNFVALNVQNDPGNYSLTLTRPIPAADAAYIGLFDNGLNCGRWVHITMGDNCNGTNDGSGDEQFCRGGLGWVADQFTGAELDFVVADSCQDENAWCRDDPYHLDQAQGALANYLLDGVSPGDMFPNYWNNRQLHWYFEPYPNYTGDINIGFINGASAYWSGISVTHLPNGIHGVQYLQNGVWTAAVMDADLGDDYLAGPTTPGGANYEIQVFDITGTLINNGRIYSFTYPSSCGSGCTPALTPVTYTTSQ